MKLKELIFHPPLNQNDIRTKEDIIWLIEDIFSIKQEEFCFNYEKEIDEKKFFFYWDQLKNIPIQYLLGYGYFLKHKFFLNKNVLIPRYETEELVLKVENIFKNYQEISVLDIGTGSGAIIFSLEMFFKKKGVKFYGVGSDISFLALEVANKNKNKFNLKSELILSDVYQNIKGKFNLIIANPPYIKEGEYVDYRVKQNEPHLALYAKNDGLEIYEKIIKDASLYLLDNAIIALEIAPEREEGLKVLLKKYLAKTNYEFQKDINGFTRFLIIYWNR